eukprot:3015835-Rhodomonas_salina.1
MSLLWLDTCNTALCPLGALLALPGGLLGVARVFGMAYSTKSMAQSGCWHSAVLLYLACARPGFPWQQTGFLGHCFAGFLSVMSRWFLVAFGSWRNSSVKTPNISKVTKQ